MQCEKCLLNKVLVIDWVRVSKNEIGGNHDIVFDTISSHFGDEETIIKDIQDNPNIPPEHKDMVIKSVLKERLISYEKTLDYLYKLSMMNVGRYINIVEEKPEIGESEIPEQDKK